MDNNKEFIRFLDALERFLHQNEKWFQKPEERMNMIEKEMGEWDQQFLEQIGNVEKVMKELEKRME
ncbi:hypothetical protein [Salinibacillus xinjiangensis]|uniref:Uncharacterized protein n=1 Tax=Salinibacillus xinjiangensis TaxID=1229268 RepID=A0A6G1X841_9BACI|nr:hypothetical protein [Salinibacillus xinjiangensis]MRG87099.1 hypothetical protein [Salinibacillus xinjiangensis]